MNNPERSDPLVEPRRDSIDDTICNNVTVSKRKQKRIARKLEKAQHRHEEMKRQVELQQEVIQSSKPASSAKTTGGKAFRARQARRGETCVGTRDDHRPSGGAPVVSGQYCGIIIVLEEFEKQARMLSRPDMVERKLVPMDNHGSMIAPDDSFTSNDKDTHENLSERSLRSFLISIMTKTFASVISLDLSRNELWDLPDLTALINLTNLDLSRNWFQDLPGSISTLPNLQSLKASHNMLRSSRKSLQMEILASLAHLSLLDVSFNQKCGRKSLQDTLQKLLPNAKLIMTISFPRPEGAFVGDSSADRDATLLRSQLEPWSTTALRRRIVADFNHKVLPPQVPRSEVMKTLLELYAEEKPRTIVKVEGRLVDERARTELLVALKNWAAGMVGGNQERTSIKAQNYIILSTPVEFGLGSKKAAKAAAKLAAHQDIWDLGKQLMTSVDPVFANTFTALAVTRGFEGSPHIDRQNVSPFYGLALGDFEDGTGGVMVECSARVVAFVNTKNRLGRIDGRYPHWVAPYDRNTKERYSLIYYSTAGEIQPVGPAVFDIPEILIM